MSRQQRHKPGIDGPAEESGSGPGERLQKVLAAAGVGSRRDCEELIREGRVEVDKQVVTELGTRVDPLRHEIRVDGEALRQPKTLYYAVNKPVGVVTTNEDPERRTRVVDLVPTEERVFAVGRLDRSSEGLILVTNDGEFANRITHPRYGVEKTYLVRVAGAPGAAELARLKKGVYLSDGVCRVQSIVAKKRHKGSTDLVIVLDEGRNRELRRILARVGHKVLRLKRIAVGPIKLADLPVGNWRRLMPSEVDSLLAVAKEKRREAKQRQRGPQPPRGERGAKPSLKPVGGERQPSPYLQQQALMSDPLSLDDLLRDDLDEGNLANDPSAAGAESDDDGSAYEFSPNDRQATRALRGEVLEYDPEPATEAPEGPAGTPRGPAKQHNRPPRGRRSAKPGQRRERAQHGQRPSERDAPPRKDFDRKQGGKRATGPPHEGGGAGDRQAGNLRFRKKAKAKRGGKVLGKKFAGTSGKPSGKPEGRTGGRQRVKPGRRGKGRR